MKKALIIIGILFGLVIFADMPQIRNVTAKQRHPWNGLVDVSFEVVGDVMADLPSGAPVRLLLTATDQVTGSNYVASTFAVFGDTDTSAGGHHVIWDLNAQGLAFKSDEVVFTIAYENWPLYCVIDLSAGANASSYPVAYMYEPPSGGFNIDEYKTTKLVLRLIEQGSFKMCDKYDVTLTRPFYCGVFEVTQRQYELVTGNNPSYFNNVSCYATRPVEHVSYNMIRGSSSGAGWPGSSAVDVDSFMGKLRTRTGIDGFDLPTEAQWEYACRAGTTTDYNNEKNRTGQDNDVNLNEVGRNRYNGGQDDSPDCGTEAGTAKVGSYLPNGWGLYDMHGNVFERCLDWYDSLSNGVKDPVGPSSGERRVVRGGSWYNSANTCTSSYRYRYDPSGVNSRYGFRLVRTLSDIVCKASGQTAQ